MSLREKMIERIKKRTGNKDADLWTLKFNENDINAKLDDISPAYINGLKIRTNEDISKDIAYIRKYGILK